ncbi:MAG: hypothetical protein NUV67_01545 [archaeon]|nr:hypothetical protein [archaeon]
MKLILSIALLMLLFSGCAQQNEADPIKDASVVPGNSGTEDPYASVVPESINSDDDYWEYVRANDIAITSSGWGTPKLLSLSSPGWEEGNYISADGKTFFYIYTTADVFKFLLSGELKEPGSKLDNNNQCTHPQNPNPHTCGKWPRADLFYSEKIGSDWSAPKPHPITLDGPVGGITLVGENKAYFMSGFEDDVEDIGYAERENGVWGKKVKIESVSSGYSDSDPYVNSEDNEMFFWSNRPAQFKGNNIYRSVKENGEWQAPELLSAPINSDSDDMQTFIFGEDLYFSSGGEPGGKMRIFKSKRLGENQWGEPELVISSKFAVGEPSITSDGKILYFEQIFADGKGNFNPDLMYVERAE